MADALGAGAGTIQLSLTAYLVLLGAGQLLFGPLSDRLGRRPVLLGGGIAYIVASIGLALASSPEIFLGFRVLQACGASACTSLPSRPCAISTPAARKATLSMDSSALCSRWSQR
ncbi:TPA: MFS transporter [Pseudomonas aeruginosa]